jgi:hypothetical protein
MASRWTSYTLALAVGCAPMAGRAAGEATAPAEPVDHALEGQDPAHPPPGSAADQALWRSGHEVTQRVQLERARATRLQAVLLNLRYTERTQALAGRDGEAGEKGKALRQQLSDAHSQQFAALTARWPVDTYRVCGYPTMEFGSMMSYGKSDPADLAKHRAMLTGCVEQAQASINAMKQGNDRLEAAMRAADAALIPAGLPPPTGAVAQPPQPAPAKDAAAAPPKAGEKHEKHEKHGDEHREGR